MACFSGLFACLRLLPDDELLSGLRMLVERDRNLEAQLLANIAEVDARKLYLEHACSSMFTYATEILGFSDSAAYNRITAARLARNHPRILDEVESGALHLSAISLIAHHMTAENEEELLALARDQSKRELERRLAEWRPKPAVQSTVRKLPPPPRTDPAKQVEVNASPSARKKKAATEEPLGRQRFKVQFTADQQTYAKLCEARALLRHKLPDGDLAALFDRALALLVAELRRKKFAETERPRNLRQKPAGSGSRHIPAAIRRAVVARDGDRCTFVDQKGRRCSAREFLEFHHTKPWARSRRHLEEEIVLLCWAHNQYAAVRDYGVSHMSRLVQ